jgi:dCTP diphosphatase
MTDILDIDQLKQIQQEFCRVREWEKFHSPKNLAMALSCESSELLELFQWLTEAESRKAHENADMKENIRDEMADIMLYLIRMADQLQINLHDAILNKIEKNTKKYPADKVKGSVKKYDQYPTE